MFKNGMRPVHPDGVLRENCLKPLGMSASALTKAINVPAPRINDVARERRGISADMPCGWRDISVAMRVRAAHL
jgi:addiction module HigA family antidote